MIKNWMNWNAIDNVERNLILFVVNIKGGLLNASLLREMPNQKGDEKRQVHHHEKR
jgi:hypothetical protein